MKGRWGKGKTTKTTFAWLETLGRDLPTVNEPGGREKGLTGVKSRTKEAKEEKNEKHLGQQGRKRL